MARNQKFREITGAICESIGKREFNTTITSQLIQDKYSCSRSTSLKVLRILKDCGILEMGSGKPVRLKSTNAINSNQKNKGSNNLDSAAEKLAGKIQTEIENGKFSKNTPFPKADYFCLHYKVSSHTVAKAMKILESQKLIYKSGKKWNVGIKSPLRKFKAAYPKVICVVQPNNNTIGDLFTDIIWSRFIEKFMEEAWQNGIHLQPILFDSSLSQPGAIQGKDGFLNYVTKIRNRFLGTLIIPPMERKFSDTNMNP